MSTNADHCTFCDLIRGAAEVSVCHEDAESIAFMDIQPVNSGHVLVVPRAHYHSLLDVPAELGMHLFRVTMRLASAIRKVTGCDDLNIVVNSGSAAGQDEPHYHVHIIPRQRGDGFAIDLPFGGSKMPDRTVLDAVAVQLIAAMRDPMKRQAGEPGGDASTKPSPGEMPADRVGVRTGAIPRNEISKMAATTTDLVTTTTPGRRPNALEREVIVKTSREKPISGDPAGRAVWQVEEGAHGELVYDRRGWDVL